jgi:hypothetical protein
MVRHAVGCDAVGCPGRALSQLGMANLACGEFARNAAWLHLTLIAVNLLAHTAARVTRSARRATPHPTLRLNNPTPTTPAVTDRPLDLPNRRLQHPPTRHTLDPRAAPGAPSRLTRPSWPLSALKTQSRPLNRLVSIRAGFGCHRDLCTSLDSATTSFNPCRIGCHRDG